MNSVRPSSSAEQQGFDDCSAFHVIFPELAQRKRACLSDVDGSPYRSAHLTTRSDGGELLPAFPHRRQITKRLQDRCSHYFTIRCPLPPVSSASPLANMAASWR